MDGYFAVIRAHQHGIAVESMNGRIRFFFIRGDCTQRSAIPRHPFNTQTQTQDHRTVQHQTLRYNLTYLRIGAQKLPG